MKRRFARIMIGSACLFFASCGNDQDDFDLQQQSSGSQRKIDMASTKPVQVAPQLMEEEGSDVPYQQ